MLKSNTPSRTALIPINSIHIANYRNIDLIKLTCLDSLIDVDDKGFIIVDSYAYNTLQLQLAIEIQSLLTHDNYGIDEDAFNPFLIWLHSCYEVKNSR